MRKKIYLHTNTEFSFLYSTIRVKELFNLAIENKLEYLPLTDVNNLSALPYYYELQSKYGIKAIVGIETKVYLNDKDYFKVILIAKNNKGLEVINNIILDASKNKYLSNLIELENENIFIIDHLEKGLVAKNIKQFQLPTNFYFNNKKLVHPQTVFAPTKRILKFEDNEILNVLEEIGGKTKKSIYTFYDYLDEDEFKDLEEPVYQNMLNMVDSIEIKEPDSTIKLPKFSENSAELFQKLIQGKRYKKLITEYDIQMVQSRILYEYETIAKLGFIDYFLIIWDALKWARENKIAIGPGRGSASGSLISYLLEITDINPLEFNLLFERFLNVDRVSLPDIDIDIQDTKRDLLLNYLQEKYGENKFALITTFQTLASKNSIRDVARVLKIPIADVNKISASLTKFDENLTVAYQKNKKYRALVDKFPNLHDFASRIEGLPRQTGLHAAGVVIANEELTKEFPVSWNANKIQQIQFNMNFLEKYGLIKIDFLGLKNLTIIQEIEDKIPEKDHFDVRIENNYSKFIDNETFKLLNKLLTNGIFQLESEGMKNAIQSVRVDTFDDLYAILSLFRPGPAQYIPNYAANKRNPKLIEKIHPLYDEIVAPTFGIIVYQEQIMEIAQKVTKMSFAQADLLRRAISKKDEEKLHSYKKTFFEQGIKNNIEAQTLERIYQNIEKFADYGFNKSHAVAYALISYKMAYYKARFPKEFYAVLLTNNSGDLTMIKKYVLDAKEQKIQVNSPLINISRNEVVIYQNQLYLPLNMIKGVGLAAVSKIIQELDDNGPFKGFIDAILRLRNIGVGESIINILIKANVLRSYGNVETLISFVQECFQIFNLFALTSKKQKIETEQAKYLALTEFIKDNGYDKVEIPTKERNIELEIEYESELLGDIYNVIPTVAQNQSNVIRKKINQIDLERSWVVVFITSFKLVKGAKRTHAAIGLRDETGSIMAYGFNENIFNLEENFKPRNILVNISQNEKKYYRVFDWKEITNNEEN
ncbi:DNA polymerase III subunit alpha [Mycoplasmopsis glycophila]|uniref:DNA-directed DNA polymerase n=1 Tax=Mycoplasmopsis glycophila TaxID=171285 RepID=A0A449AW82_9BACT|nr:DNA polymerase III subunit alpha [Mycoplasmopsis glycophila]VEU70910.1 DNA polymerase III alpha subunit [Mycoplasmopsis glycophila]